jgi:GntR family transcriptional regulator, carbon starvation induced regulator
LNRRNGYTVMDDSSITARAYDVLRAEIISCRLKPGARLNMTSLQTTHSLSQAAIREALSRLTSENLVEIERHQGFRVKSISKNGFQNLTEASIVVEVPCLRASIESGDLEWELRLVSSYHRAVRTLEQVFSGKESIDAYSRERLAFYEAVLSACTNDWLLWTWRMLYAQTMRYRHMFMPLAAFEIDHNTHHRSFLDAALARDTDLAIDIATENYQRISTYIDKKMVDIK